MTSGAQRGLILHMSVSLDGFVARPDGVIDWLSDGGAGAVDHGARRHRANLELLGQIGAIVMGRGAYEEFFRGWSGSDNPMAVLMNTLPKVIFSTTLSSLSWSNARVERGPVEEDLPALKADGDGDMVCFGGARFAHALAAHELIDEYRLTTHPVALGAGLPLWHGLPEPQRLRLVSNTVYADGSVTQTLTPYDR